MAEAKRKGHSITFDVLYYAQRRGTVERMAEIGEKEGEYIRKYLPVLNTQIPKAEDWSKFDVREVDAKSILDNIL